MALQYRATAVYCRQFKALSVAKVFCKRSFEAPKPILLQSVACSTLHRPIAATAESSLRTILNCPLSRNNDTFSNSYVSHCRFLGTTSSGGGTEGEDKDRNKSIDSEAAAAAGEDPLGVNDNDSADLEKSGDIDPRSSSLNIRDKKTGKLTGKAQAGRSTKERELLHLNDDAKERLLVERFLKSFEPKDAASTNLHTSVGNRLGEIAQRIREEEMALNVLGRSPSSLQNAEEDNNDQKKEELSSPLSEDEYKTLSEYVKKEAGAEAAEKILNMDKKENILPRIASMSTNYIAGDVDKDHDPDMDLTWMTAAAQREMDDTSLDDPFANLMPSDLNPAKKVNRRIAKPIPKSLLHHNNLPLLRRYMTPGGQIMNRVQSRLGAKDQRKIAKLIKRARHMGLIPHLGQWKYEDVGNVKAKNILTEEKDWEKELIRRGLVERRSSIWKTNQDNSGGDNYSNAEKEKSSSG